MSFLEDLSAAEASFQQQAARLGFAAADITSSITKARSLPAERQPGYLLEKLVVSSTASMSELQQQLQQTTAAQAASDALVEVEQLRRQAAEAAQAVADAAREQAEAEHAQAVHEAAAHAAARAGAEAELAEMQQSFQRLKAQAVEADVAHAALKQQLAQLQAEYERQSKLCEQQQQLIEAQKQMIAAKLVVVSSGGGAAAQHQPSPSAAGAGVAVSVPSSSPGATSASSSSGGLPASLQAPQQVTGGNPVTPAAPSASGAAATKQTVSLKGFLEAIGYLEPFQLYPLWAATVRQAAASLTVTDAMPALLLGIVKRIKGEARMTQVQYLETHRYSTVQELMDALDAIFTPNKEQFRRALRSGDLKQVPGTSRAAHANKLYKVYASCNMGLPTDMEALEDIWWLFHKGSDIKVKFATSGKLAAVKNVWTALLQLLQELDQEDAQEARAPKQPQRAPEHPAGSPAPPQQQQQQHHPEGGAGHGSFKGHQQRGGGGHQGYRGPPQQQYGGGYVPQVPPPAPAPRPLPEGMQNPFPKGDRPSARMALTGVHVAAADYASLQLQPPFNVPKGTVSLAGSQVAPAALKAGATSGSSGGHLEVNNNSGSSSSSEGGTEGSPGSPVVTGDGTSATPAMVAAVGAHGSGPTRRKPRGAEPADTAPPAAAQQEEQQQQHPVSSAEAEVAAVVAKLVNVPLVMSPAQMVVAMNTPDIKQLLDQVAAIKGKYVDPSPAIPRAAAAAPQVSFAAETSASSSSSRAVGSGRGGPSAAPAAMPQPRGAWMTAGAAITQQPHPPAAEPFKEALAHTSTLTCASMLYLQMGLKDGTTVPAGADTGAASTLADYEWVMQRLEQLSGPNTRLERFKEITYHTFSNDAVLRCEAVLRGALVRIGHAVYPVDMVLVKGVDNLTVVLGLETMLALRMDIFPAKNFLRMPMPSDPKRWVAGAPVPPRPHGWKERWTPLQDVPVYWQHFAVRLHHV
jgi:hypothetical protein